MDLADIKALIKSDDLDGFKYVVEYNCSDDEYNCSDDEFKSLMGNMLLSACKHGASKIGEFLLTHDVMDSDIFWAKLECGCTGLILASSKNHKDICRLLLDSKWKRVNKLLPDLKSEEGTLKHSGSIDHSIEVRFRGSGDS